MFICKRLLITGQLHIKIGVVIYIECILFNEDEGIKAPVAYVCRSPLIVKVYRSVLKPDDLIVFNFEVIELILVIFVSQLNMVTHAESFISYAV